MREMKDSGVEWLGKIPNHWIIRRIKNLFELRNEKNYEALEDVNLISLYTDKGVVQHSDLTETTGNKAVTAEGYKIVKEDDIVVNIILCWMGAVGRSAYNGVTSPAYDVYKPLHDTNSKYYHYLFRTSQFNGECYRYGRGIMLMRWRTYSTEFRAISVPLPPEDEQERIVNFLDKKIDDVDRLIGNVQKQIEKLKAYKQSLITQVVTKGLVPNVPMKDSGVEWIGEIAETHTVYRLKYLLRTPMQYGANESGDKFKENAVRYIRITDITADGNLKDDESNQYLPLSVAAGYILKDKDVLFARSGGTVGKSFLYHEYYGASAFAGYLIKAECDEESLLPEYLIYYTQSSLYELWKSMIFIQATIQNIGANKYSNMEIPIPSIESQTAIVEYLADTCSKIDRLIAIKQSKIEKLEQYKRSLIYEYVTGKKEVS